MQQLQDEDISQKIFEYRGEDSSHIPHKFLNPHRTVDNHVPHLDKQIRHQIQGGNKKNKYPSHGKMIAYQT